MSRLSESGVSHLEATVTPSNTPSQRMFTTFADKHGASCVESACYTESLFPAGEHEEERLLRMGPFDAAHLKERQGVRLATQKGV